MFEMYFLYPSQLSDTTTSLGNNYLKVKAVEKNNPIMRPRSPVGVQEWVASLPTPCTSSPLPYEFESITSEPTTTTYDSKDMYCDNKAPLWEEQLNYQDNHKLYSTVKLVDVGYLIVE